MTAPRVSVLMLAWKAEATIVEALQGALAQTVPCEILCSDDASPDAGFERAAAFLAGSPPMAAAHTVRLLRQPVNLGLTAHLNRLLAEAGGELIVVMAADDISLPERVATLLTAFDADPGAFVAGSAWRAFGDGRPERVERTRLPARFGLADFVASGGMSTLLGATLAFRRELVERFGPLAGHVEDNVLSLRGALLGGGLNLPQPLVRYRRSPDSLGQWLFARGEVGPAARERRYRRTIAMYRAVAADLAACLDRAGRPADPRVARAATDIIAMYRIEADARETLLERPRREWLAPILAGLRQRGLRRKSAERALKLLLPRRWLRLG
ncbi:glycosyltransferase family 2 protein [Silanimonas sp.]|uniref:glycosyltransferase family 2 protein n=1 Tax=Silanimonas sp. TaxID=1929290 RepID=UPI001BC17EE7|nr:glycosyltransferase family 2 protein [Silanimonas sp.]MBS3895197.1 glycosyltransferase family 2 protein [Silanimonas sp.]